MSTELPERPSMNTLFRELGPSLESHIAWYHHMQEMQPVRYRPEYNLWEVFRYKDVQQILLDHATFSIKKSLPDAFPGALTSSDPPQHRQLRSLVAKVFTPRRIEEMTPHVTQIVDELLEPAKVSGKINIITELTYQLPIRVIAEMLGLPPQDQERFLRWSYHLLGQMLGIWNGDNSEILDYFSYILDERKSDPHDDLISGLLVAEENGTRLTREEIINMCLEIMMGGNVTTSLLVSFVFHRLARQPELYQALRDDPSLIAGTIEETLRYDFSPTSVWRIARHDTVFNGQEIKAGQYVVGWNAAANFDATVFPHPEQFDFRRAPNPHLTFGYGVHACLGYPLARLEGRVVLERTIAHFSEICLDPEVPVEFLDQISSRNIRSLGILCTPVCSPDS